MLTVAEVTPGSIAEEIGIRPGTRLHRINGFQLTDGLDLKFYEVDEAIELRAETPEGKAIVYEIEKPAGEGLGLVPEPDPILRCTNACPFCFVKGSPKGMRRGIYLKDDDYRLSFAFGHYVTLTNLRESDFERILAQRLSPLYVSVHATDPDVRFRLLKNPRAREVVDHLRRLLHGGIELHTQVVLCRGVNDGEVLDRTIEDLYALGAGILSLSVVPVGLTRYNLGAVEQLTSEDAVRALEQVERARARAKPERGIGWCYASDELFLLAGRSVAALSYYDGQPLLENGVGSIADFEARVARDEPHLPRRHGLRIGLVTGTLMGPILARRAARWSVLMGSELVVLPTENSLFGPTVTCAGLLPGSDVRDAARRGGRFDWVLFSERALNDDEKFLDDLSLGELRAGLAPARVEPAHHVTDVLRSV